MIPAFADTSYFVAILNPRDASHVVAKALSTSEMRVITTEYILIEAANFFPLAAARSSLRTMIDRVSVSPNFVVVPSSTDLFTRGYALFVARPDKDWSLTDCISFVVMQDHGITDALTADHHFEQAGFRALLK